MLIRSVATEMPGMKEPYNSDTSTHVTQHVLWLGLYNTMTCSGWQDLVNQTWLQELETPVLWLAVCQEVWVRFGRDLKVQQAHTQPWHTCALSGSLCRWSARSWLGGTRLHRCYTWSNRSRGGVHWQTATDDKVTSHTDDQCGMKATITPAMTAITNTLNTAIPPPSNQPSSHQQSVCHSFEVSNMVSRTQKTQNYFPVTKWKPPSSYSPKPLPSPSVVTASPPQLTSVRQQLLPLC